MRKILAMLIVVSMSLSVTACNKFECDICHEEKTGKMYRNKYKSEICSECYEELKQSQKDIEEEIGNLDKVLK